jgi:hypothetical protein
MSTDAVHPSEVLLAGWMLKWRNLGDFRVKILDPLLKHYRSSDSIKPRDLLNDLMRQVSSEDILIRRSLEMSLVLSGLRGRESRGASV